MAEAKIRISAEDRTPEGFRSVERRLREFSANAAAIQNRLRGIFGGIGTAVGVGAIANFAQATVQAAVESEQAGARLDIVLRNLGDASAVSKERVEQLAEELSKIGRFDDDEIKSAAAELLKFGNISTVVFEDALRSAKGVASFFNDDLRSAAQKVAKALADPEAAFKLLKEVGVAFTESQKEALKTLGETQGVAAQQQVIVRELAKRYADLDKELSGGLTGTIQELNKAWGELLESFGLTAGKLGPVALAFNGLADVINAVRKQVDSATQLPQARQPLRGSPIEEVVPGINQKRAPNSPFLPGSRTPISEIIPGAAASPISAPALRPAPILTEADRKRLRATLGESSATLIEPSEKTGTGNPKKNNGNAGASDFDTLRRSLESQLTRERDLTVELTLVEDERFKKLNAGQQNELVSIARRVDTLKLEKIQTETVAQSIDFEKNLREISTREELAQIEERKSALLRDYEDRKISAQEYYSFIAAEETRATVIQQRELERDAGIEFDKAANTAAPINDRLNALAKEAEIRQRIADITRQQAGIEQRNARAAAQADDELLDRKVAIAQQLNSLRGTPDIELDRLALERQFRDLPEEFKASITFQTFLDTTIAEQQLDQFERSAGVVEQTLRIKEERVAIDQESGIKTNSEARSSVVEARKVAVNELQEIITKYEEVSKASGQAFGVEQQARLESLKIKLQELRATTDEYALAFKQVGEGPTQQFFEDFLSGTVSAEDAFDRFVKSVQANLLKLTADDLTKKLFGALNGDGSQGSGISGLLSGAAQFLGFGQSQQQPAQQPATQQGLQFTGGQGLLAPAASFAADLFSGGEEKDSGTDELSDAAASAATSLLGLSDNSETAKSSVEDFSASFSITDVASKIFEYFTATTAAQAGTQALATATTQAATQIAIAGATASASSFSADGNVFSGGYQMAFAKGGAFDDGALQAFATGGIVHKPTTFPIKGGRTGLMGEAGPEAIMPLTKGAGGFQVYAVGEDGTSTTLNITRNASGKLAVKLPSSTEAGAQFAMGGAFSGGIENYVMRFADGGVFTSTANNLANVNAATFSSQQSLEAVVSRTDALPIRAYAYGGIARSPQVAVFGEGSRPEAFVPLPDGRSIPVTMDAQAQGITVVQNITTPDANSFRRSRAALFNDVQSGLSAAASKS